MKKEILLIFVVMLPFFFTGCEKTDDGSYADPITLYEKLPGTWNLTGLKLVDEIARANSMEPYELEIRTQFGFSSYTLTLHIDSSYQPTTYEVASTAPELFPASGYWDLDIPFTHTDGTPSVLYFYADEARMQETGQVKITSLPGARSEMEFSLTRSDAGTPYASYVYKFRRAN
jgi:hypothetical protein